MIACRHLTDQQTGIRTTEWGDEPIYACEHRRHKQCTLAECVTCTEFGLRPQLGAIPARGTRKSWHPEGVIVDRYGKDCRFADVYRGASAFLVLGGPSTKRMPLDLLAKRGVLILSCNNCPAVLPAGIRPHVWLHTDPARKFHDSIWRDPGILKIVPVAEWKFSRKGGKGLRTRDPDSGELVEIEPAVCARDMPGVLGFHRNTAFFPEKWLFEGKINRGNDEEHATGEKKGKKVREPNGWPKTINTFFAALRIGFLLGIETLYLIGADFQMDPDQPYGFNQGKKGAGIKGNNNAYANLNVMLDGLLPHFEQAGYTVINCTPDSNLLAFDYLPFEEAIERVTHGFEQEELNCDGWYDPEPDKKD